MKKRTQKQVDNDKKRVNLMMNRYLADTLFDNTLSLLSLLDLAKRKKGGACL